MKTGLSKDEILARYPENKPVCLNYAVVRADILALIKQYEMMLGCRNGCGQCRCRKFCAPIEYPNK